MKYNIRGNKIKVTTSIKNYITSKLSKMDKYFENPDVIEARVVISIRGKDQKVEATILAPKNNIRVEEVHKDLYAAVDLVIDKMERQFRKYKTKLIDKQRKEEVSFELEDYFEENSETIVKYKKVFLKPIDEKEAITQLELLAHSFFIFRNVETNNVCVVYKRNDGGYGLIETE